MLDGVWTDTGDTVATLARLAAALAAGGVLGLERELGGHAAGLRTHMLVCLAAAASAILALDLFEAIRAAHPDANADPLRIIEGLVAAVGFLGGGVILRSGPHVHGLTTAANLWVCGMMGLAFGAGLWPLALMTLGLAFVVLAVLRFVEKPLAAFVDGGATAPASDRACLRDEAGTDDAPPGAP